MWEPYDTGFAEQEDSISDFRGEVIISDNIARGRRIINSLSTSEDHNGDFTDDEKSLKRLTLRSMWLTLEFLR